MPSLEAKVKVTFVGKLSPHKVRFLKSLGGHWDDIWLGWLIPQNRWLEVQSFLKNYSVVFSFEGVVPDVLTAVHGGSVARDKAVRAWAKSRRLCDDELHVCYLRILFPRSFS